MKKDSKKKIIYGTDEYLMYNFHKITLISFNPINSCKAIQNILGKDNVSEIQTPPDKNLAKRGIRWVRCLKGMKAEFHFVTPFKVSYFNLLKNVTKQEDSLMTPYETPFFENHVGMFVSDLTPIIKRILKHKYKHLLVKREDGLNQLYINIPDTLNYLELDSLKLNLSKIPNFHEYKFKETYHLGKKLEKKYKKKTRMRKKYNLRKKTRKYRSSM